MSASAANILRSILVDLELVRTPGVRVVPGVEPLPREYVWCFVNGESGDYERTVNIQDSVGLPGNREMHGGKRHGKPGVIINVRDLDQVAGHNLVQTIARTLTETIDQTETEVELEDGDYETHTVHSVTVTAGPAFMGEQPGTKRYQWTMNARLSLPDSEPPLG